MWATNARSIASVQALQYSLTFQRLPPSKSNDALGLDQSDKNQVITLLTISWENASDNDRVNAAAQLFISDVDKVAESMGLGNKYRYLPYCASFQDPIGGYGPASVKQLKATSKKYDPHSLFQRAAYGGFELYR